MSCSANAIVRGNTVVFIATFYNQDGQAFVPAGAETIIVYNVSGTPTTATLTMSVVGSTWTAQWDSTVADTGTVEWHVNSTGGPPNAAADGQFTISANAANPQS